MMRSPQSREWDAAAYQQRSVPQFQWGQRVLRELRLQGDECVLDAGCGTGKLTRLLLHNLPRGRAVGVDLSRNMVLHAHAELDAEFGQRASFVAADLTALPFRATFDGIFSTAALHWVLDHDALFQSLFAVLRPGGWLHAQCGGGPNLARFRDRVRVLSQTSKFVPWLGTFREPWFFSDAEGAASRLRASGFVEVTAEIEEAPVFPASVEEYNGYLRTFILHRQLEFLPTELLREAFLGELASAAKADTPPFVLDYWRLNLHARTPELLR